MHLPTSITVGRSRTGPNAAGMRSDRRRPWSRLLTVRLGVAVGSCKGRCLHAGVEAGPSAALLPALDDRHRLGLWGGVPEAAPGSAGHSGMHPHLRIKIITWDSRRKLMTSSRCHQRPMSLHSVEVAISRIVKRPGKHYRADCIRNTAPADGEVASCCRRRRRTASGLAPGRMHRIPGRSAPGPFCRRLSSSPWRAGGRPVKAPDGRGLELR